MTNPIKQSYYVKDSIWLMHKKTQNNSAMVTDLYGLMNGCSINDCVPLDTIFLLSNIYAYNEITR